MIEISYQIVLIIGYSILLYGFELGYEVLGVYGVDAKFV